MRPRLCLCFGLCRTRIIFQVSTLISHMGQLPIFYFINIYQFRERKWTQQLGGQSRSESGNQIKLQPKPGLRLFFFFSQSELNVNCDVEIEPPQPKVNQNWSKTKTCICLTVPENIQNGPNTWSWLSPLCIVTRQPENQLGTVEFTICKWTYTGYDRSQQI